MSFKITENKLLFEGFEIDHIQLDGGDYYNKYFISAFYKANKIGHQEYLDKKKAIAKYQGYKSVLDLKRG